MIGTLLPAKNEIQYERKMNYGKQEEKLGFQEAILRSSNADLLGCNALDCYLPLSDILDDQLKSRIYGLFYINHIFLSFHNQIINGLQIAL